VNWPSYALATVPSPCPVIADSPVLKRCGINEPYPRMLVGRGSSPAEQPRTAARPFTLTENRGSNPNPDHVWQRSHNRLEKR
jgi:hypothetical protein